jgi:butyryl-CoA dehydrogenase
VAVSNGLQVLGGYGYCTDFPLQQYYRDIRIFAIYEGTTGIQSLDLLGRKIPLENGRALEFLAAEITQSIKLASGIDAVAPYARQLQEKLGLVQQVLAHLLPFAKKGEYERFLSNATVFMEFFSTVVLAWLWLDAGRKALNPGEGRGAALSPGFYAGKVHAMQYYYHYELPKTAALAEVLLNDKGLTLEPPGALFG